MVELNQEFDIKKYRKRKDALVDILPWSATALKASPKSSTAILPYLKKLFLHQFFWFAEKVNHKV